jgi:hypothetical protein
LHTEYSEFIDPGGKSDYFSELESDIKKEQRDLIRDLETKTPVRKFFYKLNSSGFDKNPFCQFNLKQNGNYLLRSVNLIVKFKDSILHTNPDFKLKELLLDMYFEMYGIDTKFSNTDTLLSSRLYNRYLSICLDNNSETIFQSESVWKINVFDFTNIDLPLNYLDQSNSITMYPQTSMIVLSTCAYFYLEVILQPTDIIIHPQIRYLRPKNSNIYTIKSSNYNSWIENSGFLVGLFLCFEPIISTVHSDKLDPDYIPDLVSIKITQGSKEYLYGSESIVNFETPEFKYSILILDPSLRSREHIKDILNGYVYDSKKIHGINITSSSDYPINSNIFDIDEDDFENIPGATIELSFEQDYNYLHRFNCHENFIYLDVI